MNFFPENLINKKWKKCQMYLNDYCPLQIDNFFVTNIECHPFFHGFYWENVSEM